jgi:hypothetical protein
MMASASAALGTAKPPSAAGASEGSFAMAKGLAALEPEHLLHQLNLGQILPELLRNVSKLVGELLLLDSSVQAQLLHQQLEHWNQQAILCWQLDL